MKQVNYTNYFYGFAIVWLLLLLMGSLYSPPSSISDPGLGFLDLINFSEGGKFQYHKTPSIENANVCIEERTTWWSPGQWFFVYLLTLTGLPLGVAISFTVFSAAVVGVYGWLQLYRRFAFNETVIVICGLLILFSRYFFSAFQIYPGANILEFAVAPWMLLLWLKISQRKLWLQVLLLFLLIPAAYFVKSSMLILWLGIIGSSFNLFQPFKTNWIRLVTLGFVFIACKYLCDALFTGGGLTPFSYKGSWFTFINSTPGELVQRFLFLLSAPLTATIGIDDYVKYIFQKPGSVLFNDGHPALIALYAALLALAVLLFWYLIKKRGGMQQHYVQLVTVVSAVFVVFFIYAFTAGKNINGYEESRHTRMAGLLLLPMAVQYVQEKVRGWLLLLPFLMGGYAVMSYVSKINRPKILSEKYRIPLAEFTSAADHAMFLNAARSADLVYVVYSDLKYELDHCKTLYLQDDFTVVDFIQSRPNTVLQNKKMILLLPERFAHNGKQQAIMSNFIPGPDKPAPAVEIKKINNWNLITVEFF